MAMTVEQQTSTPRNYPRLPIRIPVQVQVTHAWEGITSTSTSGVLFNVSRGGGGLSTDWILPPRTRLAVLVPAAVPEVRLLAEVVWTSLTPAGGAETAAYGLRWVEYLSRQMLEVMLMIGKIRPTSCSTAGRTA